MCDPKSKECAYDVCSECKHIAYPILARPSLDEVHYFKWSVKNVERIKQTDADANGDFNNVKVTVKEDIVTTQDELVDEFSDIYCTSSSITYST